MSSLKSYYLLCFDVYGTLVDWESGIIDALEPFLTKNAATDRFSRTHLLTVYHDLEKEQQKQTPNMQYSQVLATILPTLAQRLGLSISPTTEESAAFGESIGQWPAFPDTVEALHRLRKHYKLVVLSNVDRASFAKTNAGSLGGFEFDLIVTAEDVGSYKPDLRNFEYMLDAVKEKFGIEKGEVLLTAQSQFHDHHPAQKVGVKSVWIERPGAVIGKLEENFWDWRFETLGRMADALEG